MRFRSEVILGGKTATGIEVPAAVVEDLDSGKRPAVRVTIGDYTYRTTIAPMAGSFWIPLSAENRGQAGVAAGDTVDVDVEVDNEPRTVTVPPDLDAALRSDAVATSFFETLSYTHRRAYVDWITSAKKDETRQRRVEQAVQRLREGRNR